MKIWDDIKISLTETPMALSASDEKREKYLELLHTQLRRLFPEFVKNIYLQSSHQREMGRVAVIEYCEGEYSRQKTFESSYELQRYFETTADTKPAAPTQRMFILEDLPRNYVEILGSQLRIPPSSFGAHWSDPTTPTFNHRSPFCKFSENKFMIGYAANQAIRVEAPSHLEATKYRWNANISRHVHFYDPHGPLVDQPKSYHRISFWTTGARSDGSWDSILIVDPGLGNVVQSLTDNTLLPVDHHSQEYAFSQINELEPDFDELDILPEDPTKWTKGYNPPCYVSIFDDILCGAHEGNPRIHSPREATARARKIAIAIFLTFLRRRTLNLLRLQSTPDIAILQSNRCDYLRNFAAGALTNWHHSLFGFIVNAKFRMGLMVKEAEANMVALGLPTPTTPAPFPSPNAAAVPIPQWERDGWTSILSACAQIIHMSDAFLTSYLQFSNMQEATAANRNALNLSKITNLTMFFVPLSSVAAVFSMSDEFQPGKRNAWVFWVTVVPILVGLGVFMVDVRGVVGRWWLGCFGRGKGKGKGRKRRMEGKDVP
ncbi:hypothetical protein GQ44DRAFT_760565 [Phaeosphaeriaceae sp. PMI808]|nr:hypothetical protein GQ44DRAFT_760565 [Phaeosphaeriaceae sp. PMI808]